MLRKVLGMSLCMAMVLGMTGCGNSELGSGKAEEESKAATNAAEADSAGGVEIPIIMTSGTNDSSEIQYGPIVKAFNEEYKGKYHITAELLAGSADDYRSKLKMLNSSESLPAVLFGVGTEPAFYDLLVENNRLVDMAPYVNEDKEWTDAMIPQSIEDFTQEDGKMYMTPVTGLQMSGIYYNKDLFKKAGITEFPETWDAFFDACEKLKASGTAPISLHTTETAWCAMLMATAHIAQTKEGMEFLEKQFPDSYDTPEFREGIEMMVRLFKDYSTTDAIGGTYALASNHFFGEDTAMIPNGPWMMPSLTDESYSKEGFEEKVGYAAFPGNVMEGSLEMGANCISVDHDQKVIEGAVEFLKYTARPEFVVKSAVEMGLMPVTVKIGQEDTDKMISPMKDYAKCAEEVKTIFPNYQTKWDPVAQQDIFGRELSNLINGSTTMDDFVKMLDEGAAQYKEDIE